MAHYIDQNILNQFKKMKKSCEDTYDVKFLYDNSRSDFNPSHFSPDQDYHLFSSRSITDKYRFDQFSSSNAIFPGNVILPILEFAEDNDYCFIWKVEYDVRFTGEWVEFFDFFKDNSSDLLGTTLFRYNFRPSWPWWNTARKPFWPIHKRNLIRGFFPCDETY